MDADRSVSRIKCLVPSCRNSRNRNTKLSFHTFPKRNTSLVENITESGLKEKIDRYKAWKIKLKLHKSPARAALVCYLYFKRDDFLLPDDLQLEESNSINPDVSTYTNHQTAGKYRAVLICLSGVQYMSSPPDNYNNMITSEAGCYWRHVRVTRPMQPQSYRVPPRVYSESRLPNHSRSNRRVSFKWNR